MPTWLAGCLVGSVLTGGGRQIKLDFINRYRDTWAPGIQCLSGGILKLDKLISHTFPLEKAEEALTLSSDVRNGSIKVQIVDEVESPLF